MIHGVLTPSWDIIGGLLLVAAILIALVVAIFSIVRANNTMCAFMGHEWRRINWIREGNTHICKRCGETGRKA